MPMSDGAVFSGYTIMGLLATGAVGEVYLVQHPRLPRQEELTLLAATASVDPDFRRRFEHEAGIAAGLSHPNISAVRDRGEHDGRLWITVDHINGTDAATLLHTDSPAGMPAEMVCDIVDAIADALDYTHTQHLLHRDVSPSHILLTEAANSRRRRILLTDFGIPRNTGETNLTNTSTAALAYSSPEQLMGTPLDGRTDQYSLAATAYHLLTGSPPFAHTNSAVLISSHLNSPPPHLADTHPNLAALDAVLAKALAKDPTARYNTCTEFTQALTAATRSGHTPTPPLAPPIAATTTKSDLPQPPITVSDWGTPKPPPPSPAPPPPSPPPPTRPPSPTQPPSPSRAPNPPPVKDNALASDLRATIGGVVTVVIAAAAIAVIVEVSSDPDPPRTATTTAPPVTITAPSSAPPGWAAPSSAPSISRSPRATALPTTASSPLITDVDLAEYRVADGAGYIMEDAAQYMWRYATSSYSPLCGASSAGVWCSVDFPPDTPYIALPWSPTGGPPSAVKIYPPNGPENTFMDGYVPNVKNLPPNHRITVGPFSCTALPDEGIDCSAPTGRFQFENGVLTKREGD